MAADTKTVRSLMRIMYEVNHAWKWPSVVPKEDYLAMAQLNSSLKSNTCQLTVSVLQLNEMGQWANFHNHSTTLLTPYIPTGQLSPLKTHSLIQPSGSFGDVLDSSVNRTASMFVIMHFHDHCMGKPLLLGVREGILIMLLIEAILPTVRLLVVLPYLAA